MQNTWRKNFFVASVIVVVVIFFHIISLFYAFFNTPLVQHNINTAIKIYPGQSAATLLQRLHAQQEIRTSFLFDKAIQWVGAANRLHFGEYQVQYPMTAWRLLCNMRRGTGLVKHKLTIVNGWTFQNMRDAITQDDNFHVKVAAQSHIALMQSLQSSYQNPEGLFYPDTYFFTWGNSDMTVLKVAYQKMQHVLQTAWENRAPNLPYINAYQALIVASLIERETSLDSEKPIIASVILNRLAKKMRLQVDPSVQYGLGKSFGSVITKEDLSSKTKYNTYFISGLPPTPICMPSVSSINAALHPATTDYLYYIATGVGGHHFSKTYAEHEKQVAQYRRTI